MNLLRKLFGMSPSRVDVQPDGPALGDRMGAVQDHDSTGDQAVSGESLASVEDVIAFLRKRSAGSSVCWVVCYEDRPLQGAPPGSAEPHLLIFRSRKQADAFILGRRQYFMPEPLSITGVDSAVTLKKLLTLPAVDSRYEGPPCGLLLNFSYPAGACDRVISPAQAQKMDARQLASTLGLRS